MNRYIAAVVQHFHDSVVYRRERPEVPKGMRLYRRRARNGEQYDRALIHIKSKGRTGAAARYHIAQSERGLKKTEILITWDGKKKRHYF